MSDEKQPITPLMFTAALAVAALAGVVATYIVLDLTRTPAPAPAAAPLTSEAAQAVAPPSAAAVAAAESEMVRLYEGINNQFVAQLRSYGTRLNAIADVAEAEGAATASEQMRELGQETDDLIARYDRITKQ